VKKNRSSLSTESPATSVDHRIYTDLPRLLRARHWAKDLSLFSRSASRSLLLGETRSRFRGRGMEFEEVRRYQRVVRIPNCFVKKENALYIFLWINAVVISLALHCSLNRY